MAASPRARRLLVLANESCAGSELFEAMRERADGPDSQVLVVAPALTSRLRYWMSDEDAGIAAAEQRLAASLERCGSAGIPARGALGDADPLQALDDALRIYDPDEVVISTHPHQRSNWLERQVVQRARERYDLPITHVVVDLEHEREELAGHRPARAPRGAPRRLRVFHASDYDEALTIRAEGFRDAPSGGSRSGVWVTDRPPRAGSEGDAQVMFAVDVPEDALGAYEEAAEGEARRFLLPAELLNRHGPPVADGDWSE